MCAEAPACLVLRLEGPLQSWGTVSQFDMRMTDLLPSRSGILGMLCAALGLERGCPDETAFLQNMQDVRMLAVAVPRRLNVGRLPVRRMEDFHTIRDTLKAGGGYKNCHITRRQYLTNASFVVFLSGNEGLLKNAGAALQNPVWGIWLGRKACIPSAPVYAGMFPSEEEALNRMLPDGISGCIYCRDATSFDTETDSVADVPLSFASSGRKFVLRRIRRVHGASISSSADGEDEGAA